VTARVHPDWDELSSLGASVEGWDIFPGFGDKGRPFLIEARMALHVFASDEAAWRHVWGKAHAGSALHLKALDLMKRFSPVEYAEIRKFGLGLNVSADRFHSKQESNAL
jgi:hypothetical protein